MKSKLVLLLISITFVLIGCSNDDDLTEIETIQNQVKKNKRYYKRENGLNQ